MSTNEKERAIVVRRVAPARKGHHGGAWKLAYADFMTAMMAFFLLMWLLSSVSPPQLHGIAKYFQQPLRITLWGGQRSAEDSSIVRGGGRDVSTTQQGVTHRADTAEARNSEIAPVRNQIMRQQVHAEQDAQEQARLHELQIRLMDAIEANPVLRQFKQQIRIESTLTGLRIEIVDSQKRPMFATASDQVEPYMRDILRAIGQMLNDVPNHIVVQGHTDAVPYAGGEKGYSNWELSSDRANASRRELIAGGMDESKVLRVIGLASSENLDKANPLAPENRRISIIVLNHRSEAALMHDDTTATTISDDAAGAQSLLPGVAPASPAVAPPAEGAAPAAAP
ncbi:motility protein MotB [Burkholderia sp. WAC0059]|uniref:flagellar motor protein MotB n=1 Tax=Burkholderia sp. WAC0059 TaxID=2066022 RepID=UPI000C7E8EE4|nr:flagellar motor protein MotB [Burkholderia sp. WAC0059]PLZ01893.1 motility protein MotB [Burkholderia sp. WAC0059]